MAASNMSRRVVSLSFFIFLVSFTFYIGFVACHGHTHDHHEPAHDKYSRAANEQHKHPSNTIKDENRHEHHHDGHGHDAHGHSHDGHGHGHGSSEKLKAQSGTNSEAKQKSNVRPSTSTLWMHAIGSTALVSVAPVFILLVIPLDQTDAKRPLLKVLLSFASGGLLGDAFLHLIPHAILPHSHNEGSHGHGHSHSHSGEGGGHSHEMGVGLGVLAGIVAFLIVEKFVRYVKGGHGHSHGPPAVKKPTTKNAADKNSSSNASDKDLKKRKKTDGDKVAGGDDEKSKSEQEQESHVSDIKVAGYLNLAADFAHNFTDGLAIGASYLAGNNVGIITTITILLHEVPHEIGDFAILVQSGCSKKKAMMLQFTTAIGAMMGTLFSLIADGFGQSAATSWILPFTAGGFIYIATVSVIPELLEDSKIWQSVKEIIALLIGVYMMVLIAEYE